MKTRTCGGLETRLFTAGEFRIEDDGKSKTVKISGYALTYGQAYRVFDGGPGGGFTEEILPGAAERAASSSSCILQVNHSGIALARVPSTMRLQSDAHGLRYEADLDTRSAAATDLLVALERRDVQSSSFGFRLSKGDDTWSGPETHAHRKIHNISEIFDVSPVNNPANPNASASIEGRSIFVAQFVDNSPRRGPSRRTTTDDLLRELGPRVELRLERERAENRIIVANIVARRAREAAEAETLAAVHEIRGYTPTRRPARTRAPRPVVPNGDK